MEIVKVILTFVAKMYHLALLAIESLNLSDSFIYILKVWSWGGVASIIFYIASITISFFLEAEADKHNGELKRHITYPEALLNITSHSRPLFKYNKTFFNLLPIALLGWLSFVYLIVLFFGKRYQKEGFELDIKVWGIINLTLNVMLFLALIALVIAALMI